MPQINIANLSFAYPGSYDNVFENISLSLDTSWRLGLIGRNGKGKTTFLKLLCGEYDYAGHISAPVDAAYFPAPVPDPSLDTLSALESASGGAAHWRILRELPRLRLDEEILYRPFSTLSGGEQTKALLGALFLRENGFLLIDEPTNHLDAAARKTVTEYLSGKSGFILVSHDRALLDGCVDHVLAINRCTIELQKGNFSSWYYNKAVRDQFELMQNARLKKDISRLETAAKRTGAWSNTAESRKIGFDPTATDHSAAGRRPYQGEKSRKAMKRSKVFEARMEKAAQEKRALLKDLEETETLFLQPVPYVKNRLLSLRDVSLYYGDKCICASVDLEVCRGWRLAVAGPNGSGKTTLLRAVCGGLVAGIDPALPKDASNQVFTASGRTPGVPGQASNVPGQAPDALVPSPATPSPNVAGSTPARLPLTYTGALDRGSGLRISYVSQDTTGLKGTLSDIAYSRGIDESLFKALLRKLDFERVQFEKEVSAFSQGQKKKVLLAASLCERAHIYVWDEPLNFIDIFSRMQIEQMLTQSDAAMIFIEHDAAFCDAVATHILNL